MDALTLELGVRWAFLASAVLILPSTYLWILWKVRRERIKSPPRRELFVGIGSLGGWSLFLALIGSGPLIILPIAAFQMLIAFPASLYCLLGIARRRQPTGFHTAAVWLLALGVLIPVACLGLSILVDS